MIYLTNVTQIVEDPLFWLWALLGAAVLIGAGILISWFWGKPVVKFIIDGECTTIMPISRGEKLVVPIELSEYNWFSDKAMTKPIDKEIIIKKRVMSVYSGKVKMSGGVEN